jgi:hypothetical protein
MDRDVTDYFACQLSLGIDIICECLRSLAMTSQCNHVAPVYCDHSTQKHALRHSASVRLCRIGPSQLKAGDGSEIRRAMSFETVNTTQVPSRTKGHEDNGNTGARDACDRRCSQRTHYSTIINTPIQETSTELPPLHTQAQTQAQVPPKVSVAAVARSASRTDQQMQMGKLIDGKLGILAQAGLQLPPRLQTYKALL